MAQHDNGDEPVAERSQVPDRVSPALTEGYRVAIRRSGQAVEITLAAGNEYASVELYDSLVQSMKNGSLRLNVKFAR